ncbi:hypothetical protein LCGC14_1200460 [marine sediment metagenome]|uniref:Uncharacterized protein n=1 Tax=marine sediment metagenome TaxID=412755 RepID=A0A0F9PLU7_9ZZZZ
MAFKIVDQTFPKEGFEARCSDCEQITQVDLPSEAEDMDLGSEPWLQMLQDTLTKITEGHTCPVAV